MDERENTPDNTPPQLKPTLWNDTQAVPVAEARGAPPAVTLPEIVSGASIRKSTTVALPAVTAIGVPWVTGGHEPSVQKMLP